MAVGMFGNLPDLEFTGGGCVIVTSDGDPLSFLCVTACVGQPERTIFTCKDAPAFI